MRIALNEIGKRISDPRDYRNLTKRELAARLGISESQLSRIESGKTATISSDILIGLAREFNVSADYILGLSPNKSNDHILSELRLSEAACEKLIRREIDGVTLSRWMEQERFGELIRLSYVYFADIFAEGVGYRNAILDAGAGFLRDHSADTEEPDAFRRAAGNAAHAKTKDHEIELSPLQSLTRSILPGAKAQYEREHAEDDPALKRRIVNQAFSAKLREIAEEVKASKGTEEERLDLLTDRMLKEVQAQTALPDGVIKTLKPVYKRTIRRTGQDEQNDTDE